MKMKFFQDGRSLTSKLRSLRCRLKTLLQKIKARERLDSTDLRKPVVLSRIPRHRNSRLEFAFIRYLCIAYYVFIVKGKRYRSPSPTMESGRKLSLATSIAMK